jgi:Ca2+:H+ antiporter
MTDPTSSDRDPLADAAQLLIDAARAEAASLGHGFIGTEHILLALLVDPALATSATERGAPGREELRARLVASAAPRTGGGEGGGLSSHARRLVESGSQAAREAGRATIDRRWLLDRILDNPRGPMARLLAPSGQPAEAPAAKPEALPRDTRRQPKEPKPQAGRAKERGAEGRRAAAPSKPRDEGGKQRPGDPPQPSRSAARPDAPTKVPRPVAPIRSRPHYRIPWRLLFLLLVPATVVLQYVYHADPVLVFVVACLGVIPLAGYMGEATEQLAARTGPAVGGLLNATFGNAAELIIAIVALRAGLVDLVKASITGSILGNLLLILGLSLVAGGIGRPVLKFNRTSTGASAGMLALAVVGLVFPALFHALRPEGGPTRELHLSEMVAVVLAVTYGLSLLFTLRTHRRLFAGEPHPAAPHAWRPLAAVGVLALATVGVAVLSEILVHAVEGVTATMGLSETFLGLIIIPLIGNAAEHATAIVVARKGQTDLALQIALGSSTQVALLVAPVLVLAGVLLGQSMDLVFTTFEVAAVGLATVVTAIVTLDGESHWFEGAQLLAVYALVAATAFFI